MPRTTWEDIGERPEDHDDTPSRSPSPAAYRDVRPGHRRCPECEGEGEVEVLDEGRIRSNTIDPPYKMVACDDCDGDGDIPEEDECE